MIPIAVISDHKLAGSGISALIREQPDFEVLGPHDFDRWRAGLAGSAEPAVFVVISRQRNARPGQLISELHAVAPEARAVFISLVEDEQAILAAIRVGVEGALDVSADAALLVRCIRDVLSGEVVISKEVARKLMGEYGALASGRASSSRRDVLTPRETIIIRLIARGDSNKAIAHQLSISEHTVRAHVRSIMRKLEVANRVQAAAVALRSGLAAS